MMKIYTSRFKNPLLDSGKYFAVGITLGKPKFKLNYEEGYHSYLLAPRGWMWKIVSDDDFNRAYRENLDKIGKYQIKRELQEIEAKAHGKPIVLLCYEDVRDESQSCHRTVLADWLNQNLGLDVKELDDPTPCKPKKKTKPVGTQLTLF